MERRLPSGINPLQLVALYVLLQAVRDAIVAEGESDIHDRDSSPAGGIYLSWSIRNLWLSYGAIGAIAFGKPCYGCH